MKTSKYIVIVMVALGMVACNFFESESPSAMDAAAVFSNENNTELAIAAVYEQFGQDKSYRNRLACGYQGMNTELRIENLCPLRSNPHFWLKKGVDLFDIVRKDINECRVKMMEQVPSFI